MTGPPRSAPDSPASVGRRPRSRVVLPTVLVLGTLTLLLAGSLPMGSPGGSVSTVPSTAAAVPLETAPPPVVGSSNPTPAWTQIPTADSPPARQGAAMAYDAKDGYTVLFGGAWINGTNLDPAPVALYDTWTYRGGLWAQLRIPGPPVSVNIAAAYDPVDGYVVLFGGCAEPCLNASDQTWTFSGGLWSRLDVPGPPAMIFAQMAWDPPLGELVLCGGVSANATIRYTDTWGFAHGGWTNLDVVGPTPFPLASGMSYVPAAGGLVVFGGESQPVFTTSDTWFFDGSWTHLDQSGPAGREGTAMTYEMTGGFGVLFGGTNKTFHETWWNLTLLGDTWIYTGSGWVQEQVPGPSPVRGGSQFTYDAGDGYALLFGGMECYHGVPTANCSYIGEHVQDTNDTWAFSLGPIADQATVTVTPTAVCVVNDHSCAAGTWQGVVNVSILADYSGARSSVATLSDPVMSVLPWGEVQVDLTRPAVSCQTLLAAEPACDLNATALHVGGIAGLEAAWSSASQLNALYVGDLWTVEFGITVAGPPYGSVPVYACTTTECLARGSDSVEGRFSAVSFFPLSAGPEQNDSLPFANITVDPPRIPSGGSSPPVTNVPPTGQAPIPLPSPVTLPSPVVLPTPILAIVVVGVPAVSVTAAAAGILSAGFARAAIQRRAISVGQPVGNAVRAPRSAFEPERGTDVAVGRFE